MTLHPQYITDKKGKKKGVVLPIKEYTKLMEELEELEDIRLYDEAKADKEPSIPADEAFRIVESRRKNRK